MNAGVLDCGRRAHFFRNVDVGGGARPTKSPFYRCWTMRSTPRGSCRESLECRTSCGVYVENVMEFREGKLLTGVYEVNFAPRATSSFSSSRTNGNIRMRTPAVSPLPRLPPRQQCAVPRGVHLQRVPAQRSTLHQEPYQLPEPKKELLKKLCYKKACRRIAKEVA